MKKTQEWSNTKRNKSHRDKRLRCTTRAIRLFTTLMLSMYRKGVCWMDWSNRCRVELKRMKIFVNGKKIDYLTLNGKDFFNGNNKLMLENLPYYMVEKIKVYNKQTERAASLGLKGVKPDYVMDVNLKRQYSQGYIANIEGGAGSEDSYINRLFGFSSPTTPDLHWLGIWTIWIPNITHMKMVDGMKAMNSDVTGRTTRKIGYFRTKHWQQKNEEQSGDNNGMAKINFRAKELYRNSVTTGFKCL